MGKTSKRILIGIIIAAAIAGAIFAGLTIYRNVNKKPVPVYDIELLAMTDPGSDMTMTSGSVSSEGIQKVFLSGTQTVADVAVKEGQEVKKGDVLFSYDTTLTQIEVERARVKVGRLNLDLSNAQKELDVLNNSAPQTTQVIEPDHTVEYNPSETPLLLMGSGTSEDPYIYLFDEFDSITGELLNKLIAKSSSGAGGDESESEEQGEDAANEEEPSDDDVSDEDAGDEISDDGDFSDIDDGSVYVVIINRENNALNAEVTAKHGVRLDVSDGSVTGIGLFEPFLPEEIESFEEQPEAYEVTSGSEYTEQELIQMRAQKTEEIQDLKRSIALAQNEYEQKKLETDEGVVKATIDGVVSKVRDENESAQNNEAFIELSAGGAYFVTGTLGEFDLENVHVGDPVTVQSYSMNSDDTGFYEGEITEISDKVASSEDDYGYFSYGEGNSNVSYYPFKVKLKGDVNLRDDDYVEISYMPESEASGGAYIPNAFIRRDGGDSYVYVKGENGLLEKRSVKVGRELWGEYTQIKGGLSSDDKLAFPYGKDVAEGAKTKESNDLDELYGDAYAW